MRFLVIRNPAAGRGRAARGWGEAAARLRASGIAFDEAVTAGPGDAVVLAREAASGYDVLVAAGGDGTVHEVVNGLMQAGGGAALAVLPLGSGDDFAKLLVPNAGLRMFDVGRIEADGEARFFANGMDIGFGAHGAANVRRVPGFLKGFGAYLGALVLTMIRYPQLEVELALDDAPPRPLRTAMTAVMNGTTFGGSFRVTPGARPDDGRLDVLLVDAIGRLEILRLVPKILAGTHGSEACLRLARAARIRIASSAPLLVEADGELAFDAARRLEVSVLPGALRVFS